MSIAYITNQEKYIELSASPTIQVINKEFAWFYQIPDIDMDRFMVLTGNGALGTSGVGPCFAVCLRGKTITATPVLGLCHTSHIINFKAVLRELIQRMIYRGCVKKTIEIFVVGGEAPSKELPFGTILEQNEVVDLADDYNIQGAKFNPIFRNL